MKTRYDIDPSFIFEYELSCIKDDFYVELVLKALWKAPHYFFYVPASSSGKYHPKSSLGLGGLLRHVQSVFRISEELLNHPTLTDFTDEEKDQIRAAILLHDTCKQGIQNEPTNTVTEHPLLVKEALKPYSDEEDVNARVVNAWDSINKIIETHMGPWTTDTDGNEVLKKPTTRQQIFMHQCDYLASRKILEVDVTPRKPQSGDYGQNDWKADKATSSQMNFLENLMERCIREGVTPPKGYTSIEAYDSNDNIICTKGMVSEYINEYKKVLGLE